MNNESCLHKQNILILVRMLAREYRHLKTEISIEEIKNLIDDALNVQSNDVL